MDITGGNDHVHGKSAPVDTGEGKLISKGIPEGVQPVPGIPTYCQDILSRGQKSACAGSKDRMVMPHRDETAIEALHGHVFLSPWEGASTEGVLSACNRGFVAIVDTGHAREAQYVAQHQAFPEQPDPPLLCAQLPQSFFRIGWVVPLAAGENVENSRQVMSSQHVHQRIEDNLRIILLERHR